MAAYSSKDDLLVGGIPTPAYLNLDKLVQDASDEIDSKIGFRYETPINIGTGTPLERPAQLLLKRINNFLATGRLILQVASPEEDTQLHAYGWNLVKEATAALDAIASGQIDLEGAVERDQTADVAVPLIDNLDPESNVEAFYNRIGNPNYVYPPLVRYTNPDRLVD